MSADWGNEPIAAPGNGFDEEGCVGTIAECVAHIQDALLHGLWLDHTVAPHAFEQFLVRDQPSRVLDEIRQDGKRLGRHLDALRAVHFAEAPQTLIAGVEAERREFRHR